MNRAPADAVITLFINSKNAKSERRFDPSLTILSLKEKLSPIVGIPASTMIIKFKNQQLLNDRRIFEYDIANFDDLFISTEAPELVDFNELGNVKKYEMAQEEYEAKTDSVLHFKKVNKIGRFSEKSIEKKREEEQNPKYLECEYKVGDRMILKSSGDIEKRGRVAYVGFLPGKQGYFVGVELDEPLGKNNGDFEGSKLFECGPKRGMFVRPDQVIVGDYPELDLFDEF